MLPAIYGTVKATSKGVTIQSERPILMALVGPGSEYGGIGRIAIRGETKCGSYYASGDLAICTWSSDYRTLTLKDGGFNAAGKEVKYILFCE